MINNDKPKKQATLCVFVDKENERILLGMKKRGFGVGKYNGFGGKVNQGEKFEEAALREFMEESCLQANLTDLNKVGEFDFYFLHKPEFNQTVHVYWMDNINGEPGETEEMAFKWFSLDEIPYSQMWDDDKYWLPLILKGKKLKASFIFKNINNENIVAEKNIEEVNNF
ncbi:MAG: 8-oxo-dGTP diphosphatase [archaeon]|nr:8-oxo-dGTP diphosphatase [archaeon]